MIASSWHEITVYIPNFLAIFKQWVLNSHCTWFIGSQKFFFLNKKKKKKIRQIITIVSNRLHEKLKKKEEKKHTGFKENFFWLDANGRVRHKRRFPHVLHILSQIIFSVDNTTNIGTIKDVNWLKIAGTEKKKRAYDGWF